MTAPARQGLTKVTPIALGLRAVRSGAIAAAVTIASGRPRLVAAVHVATAEPDDALAAAPYAAAASHPRLANGRASARATAAITEGRRRQGEAARANLAALLADLRARGHAPSGAALLVHRATWITDLTEYALMHPEHVPVADGLAVREALRAACANCGIAVAECDEKSLPTRAQVDLAIDATKLAAELGRIGLGAKPWRKEHKLAALAAWHLLATGGAERMDRKRSKPKAARATRRGRDQTSTGSRKP